MSARKPGSLEPDAYCNAVTKGGALCRNVAGFATDHAGVGRCGTHGGKAPSYAKSLAYVSIKQKAIAYGERKGIDPLTALLNEIDWTDAHTRWLRERIQELPDDVSLIRRRELIGLYRAERSHLVKACEAAIRLDLTARVIRLRESEVAELAQVVTAALGRLGYDDEQQRKVMRALASEVRARGVSRGAVLPAIPPADPLSVIDTSVAAEPEPDVPQHPHPLPRNVTILGREVG